MLDGRDHRPGSDAGGLVDVRHRDQPGGARDLRLPPPRPQDIPPRHRPEPLTRPANAFRPPQGREPPRRGTTVWELLLSDRGVPSTVVRCPVTYPPDATDQGADALRDGRARPSRRLRHGHGLLLRPLGEARGQEGERLMVRLDRRLDGRLDPRPHVDRPPPVPSDRTDLLFADRVRGRPGSRGKVNHQRPPAPPRPWKSPKWAAGATGSGWAFKAGPIPDRSRGSSGSSSRQGSSPDFGDLRLARELRPRVPGLPDQLARRAISRELGGRPGASSTRRGWSRTTTA